jgi:stage V sporulation protein SpoVS
MRGEEQARLRVASAAASLNWHGRDLILVGPAFVHLDVKGEENFGKKEK